MANRFDPFCDLRFSRVAGQEVSKICHLGQRFITGEFSGLWKGVLKTMPTISWQMSHRRSFSWGSSPSAEITTTNVARSTKTWKYIKYWVWEFTHNLPSSSYSWKQDVNTLYSRVRHSYQQWGHVPPSLTFYEASKETSQTTVQGIRQGLRSTMHFYFTASSKFNQTACRMLQISNQQGCAVITAQPCCFEMFGQTVASSQCNGCYLEWRVLPPKIYWKL